MHTEHLQNVSLFRVVAGWLVAIAVTSMIVLIFAGLNLPGMIESTSGGPLPVLAVAVGFAAGGFFTGFRALEAPILHGAAIGLMSLVAWFGVNVVMEGLLEPRSWEGLSPATAAAVLLVQVAAAVAGAWAGYKVALRGGPEPEDLTT